MRVKATPKNMKGVYMRRSATEAQLGLEFESAWSIEFEFEF